MSALTDSHRIRTIVALFGIVVAVLWLSGSMAFAQAGEGHVGVLFQFADGRVLTRYLELSTPVDRLTALEATGLAFESAFGGDAICKIEEEGCPGNDTECWCQCTFTPGETCTFWIYFPMNESGDTWGDLNTWPLPELEDGHVAAWVWGELDVVASPWEPLVEPPFLTVGEMRERALTPGLVSATGGKAELAVTASYGGDSDGSGSATVRYRRSGGPSSEPQAMVPGEASFGFTITGLEPGEYEVEVTYSDYESGVMGPSGETRFTAPAAATSVSAAEEGHRESEAVPPSEVPSPEATTPSLTGYLGTISLGGIGFVVIVAVLLIIYLRKRAY